jgi:hypothetical protein
VIEAADLPRTEAMRRNGVGQPLAVGGVGARHGHQVLHGGVGDDAAALHVLLDRLGQRADETQAPRHPAHAAIEAPRQSLECQTVLLMQRAQQPPLLERTVGGVGVEEVPKDERLGLRHLPHDGGDRVALQPTQAADALVPIDHE